MSSTNSRSFLDMTSSQQELFLQQKIAAVQQENLELAQFNTYTNELCVTPDLFIREYQDGKKQLVHVNMKTGSVEIVRTLG